LDSLSTQILYLRTFYAKKASVVMPLVSLLNLNMGAGENEKVGVKWYGMAATIMARMTYLAVISDHYI